MDSLPARFLKDGAMVIACSLSHIINLSLHSGQIPQYLSNVTKFRALLPLLILCHFDYVCSAWWSGLQNSSHLTSHIS